MNAHPQTRASARTFIIRHIAAGNASDFRTEKVFKDCQSWNGFAEAFSSWELAFWKWVDDLASPEKESEWREKLFADKSRYTEPGSIVPPEMPEMEAYLQGYLLRRALFLTGLQHKKETNPQWFKYFANYLAVAERLDDDAWFQELARLTQRKTSEDDKGKRSLQYWLLMLWIPACFWASTNNGMSNALVHWELASAYSEGAIRNQISKLRLSRPTKPLIFGIDKNGNPLPL